MLRAMLVNDWSIRVWPTIKDERWGGPPLRQRSPIWFISVALVRSPPFSTCEEKIYSRSKFTLVQVLWKYLYGMCVNLPGPSKWANTCARLVTRAKTRVIKVLFSRQNTSIAGGELSRNFWHFKPVKIETIGSNYFNSSNRRSHTIRQFRNFSYNFLLSH